MKLALGVLYAAAFVSCQAIYGVIQGVPRDAIDASGRGVASPIVNGLNFQSRTAVTLLRKTDDGKLERHNAPVKLDYSFEVPDLQQGEYELEVHSYDFSIANSRYRIKIDDQVRAFEDYLGHKSHNASSEVLVSPEQPLRVQVIGYKEYYDTPDGKLSALLMNSPLGPIFANRLYTMMFIATLIMMATPYILSIVAPEFAEELKKAQTGDYKRSRDSRPVRVEPVGSSAVASGLRGPESTVKKLNKRGGSYFHVEFEPHK